VSDATFEGFAVLELMGHRRLAGYVREATLAGGAFLRIDLIASEHGQEATQFYSPASVYALTPCTEEVARKVAERTWDTPARQLALPAPRQETPYGLRECVCGHVSAAHADRDDMAEGCLIEGCACTGFDEADVELEHEREGMAF